MGKTGASRRGNPGASSGVRVYWAYSIRSRPDKFLVKSYSLTVRRAKNTIGLEIGGGWKYFGGSGKML